jgi:hypothetical protein
MKKPVANLKQNLISIRWWNWNLFTSDSDLNFHCYLVTREHFAGTWTVTMRIGQSCSVMDAHVSVFSVQWHVLQQSQRGRPSQRHVPCRAEFLPRLRFGDNHLSLPLAVPVSLCGTASCVVPCNAPLFRVRMQHVRRWVHLACGLHTRDAARGQRALLFSLCVRSMQI